MVSKVTMLFERLIDYRLSQQQRENRYLRLSATHSLIVSLSRTSIKTKMKKKIMWNFTQLKKKEHSPIFYVILRKMLWC